MHIQFQNPKITKKFVMELANIIGMLYLGVIIIMKCEENAT